MLNRFDIAGDGLCRPQWFGAKADNSRDDSGAIQSAINAALNAGAGGIEIPPGTYRIASKLTVPITARNFLIRGYGATLQGAVNDTVLQCSDLVTTNNALNGLFLEGFRISGSGGTDTVYGSMNGIEIDASINVHLKNIVIENIPNKGIILSKSGAAGSAYANLIQLDHVSVRFCGSSGLYAGEGGAGAAIDDLTCICSMFNNLGQKVSISSPDGGVHVHAVTAVFQGGEISAVKQSGGTHGFRWGAYMRQCSGGFYGTHFENNGNNQAGAADVMLDSDADGFVMDGCNHFSDGSTGAKSCVHTTSDANRISNFAWYGATYDYLIDNDNAGGCTNLDFGAYTYDSTPPTGLPNIAILSNPLFGRSFNTKLLPIYANNAAAVAAGALAGNQYRTNGDPDIICTVH